MKRLGDGFVPTGSVDCVSESELILMTSLPEDVLIRIFSELSLYSLRPIFLVCRTFKIYLNSDVIWHPIAESILLPKELQEKPADVSYKNYCVPMLCPQNLGEKLNIPVVLEPRDPNYIKNFKQMQLPDYTLLNLQEAKDILLKVDTIKLLNLSANKGDKSINLKSIANQQVGSISFEFFNGTNYFLSFNSERHLLINNKDTGRKFNDENCQIFIFFETDFFHMYIGDIGSAEVIDLYCSKNDIDDFDKFGIKVKKYFGAVLI